MFHADNFIYTYPGSDRIYWQTAYMKRDIGIALEVALGGLEGVHFPQFGLWLEQLGPLYWPDEQP